jgi:LacI family transcriptional regulator
LIIETSTNYGRSILEGIAGYLRSHHRWSLFVEEHELGTPPPTSLTKQRWDGILCRPMTPALASRLRRMKVSVVDLNDLYGDLNLPWVRSDHAAIGRLGAGHLLERGFRHFAFCGFSGELWATERLHGFRAFVEENGYSALLYESAWRNPSAPQWDLEIKRIGQWLKAAPKPLGVMACNDVRGLHLLDTCQEVGLMVPEEVAVVGVDNDKILCELCDPPLSSVAPDPERIGYAAAELLDSLMAGKPAPTQRILIAPHGVVTRRSSDVLAISDRIVAAATRFIRDQAEHGCRVEDVLRHVHVSRSVLERGFRKHLQRSPQAQIRLTQIGRVKLLLTETDFTLERIAELSGFEYPEYMSVVFRRTCGQTPGDFRKQFGRVSRIRG